MNFKMITTPLSTVVVIVTSFQLVITAPVVKTSEEKKKFNLSEVTSDEESKLGFNTTSEIYTNTTLPDLDSTKYQPASYYDDIASFWTEWFNTDNPAYGKGDLESPSFIADRLSVSICPKGTEIVYGDCRNAVTHKGPPFNEDILLQSCGKFGILCRNKDQIKRNCTDFEVRFKCQVIDESRSPDIPYQDQEKTFYNFDVRIYIVLAVIPFSIFIIRICWTFTWDKRNRRFVRRNTRGRIRRSSVISVNSELFRPPPSYSELFGENRRTFTLSRNYKLCELCSLGRCSLYTDINSNRSNPLFNGSHSESTVMGRQNASSEGHSNGSNSTDNSRGQIEPRSGNCTIQGEHSIQTTVPENKPVPNSDSSGGSMVSITVPTSSDNSNVSVVTLTTPTSSEISNVSITTLASSDNLSVSVSTPTNSDTSDVSITTRPTSDNSTTSEATVASNSNSASLDTSNTSADNGRASNLEQNFAILRIHAARQTQNNSSSTEQQTSGGDVHVTSEQCTCPCHKSTVEEANYDNPSFVHDDDTNDDSIRRMPGMHVPVFITWSVDTPPPTYREALKILKKNKSVRC